MVPLLFRVIVFSTSVIALSISASVHHLSNKYIYSQNASTTIAIIVDVIAIPYILYITWDEYTGKPLGLRSPKAKIRLVLLDLFFIIFESANLALAFGALTDNDGACQVGPDTSRNGVVCGRVKALCAILMIALISWSLTFTVSIFRYVCLSLRASLKANVNVVTGWSNGLEAEKTGTENLGNSFIASGVDQA